MGRADSKATKTQATKAQRKRRGSHPRAGDASVGHPLMRLAMRLPMLLIGVVVALLIPAPFTEHFSGLNDFYQNHLGALIVGVALASILIASVVGAVIMMGRRAAIVGVVFTASIGAAGLGSLTGAALWTNLGMGGFALSCAGFYLIGELSGYLPISTAASYGSVAMIPGGIIMAVMGMATQSDGLVLLGLGGAGAAVGVTLARLYRRRRLVALANEAAAQER